MKLEDSPTSTTMTPTNTSPNLHAKQQLNNKLIRQSSSGSTIQRRNQYMAYQRRQNMPATNDFLNQHTPSKFSVPLLTGAMNEFFQATKVMEDEIMLPSRLKDMPVDGKFFLFFFSFLLFISILFLEVVLDNSVQPNTWHELYTFVRDVRNQLSRSRPFIDDDDNNSEKQEFKEVNDDEGILLPSYETNQHSSASSTVSSDELEHSTTSSNTTSFDTIQDELKYHFFGLLGSFDHLKTMANRVTEKYREDSTFKV
jgi:hypothetical protein